MTNSEKKEKTSKLDAILSMVGLEAVYEPVPENVEKRDKRSSRQHPASGGEAVPWADSADGTYKSQIILMEPEKRSEAQKITEYLKSGKTVVINVEKMDKDDVVRLWDYITGATYALEGKTQVLNEKVLITAPHNVDIRTTNSQGNLEPEEDEEYELD